MKPRSILAIVFMVLSTHLLLLSILEISFPGTFSISMRSENLKHFRMHVGIAEVVLAIALLIPAFRLDRTLSARILESTSRVGIGGMFVFASWFKIQNPQAFALLVAQYQMLPQWSINLFALFTPQLELWAGLALVLTKWTREMSIVLSAMFIAFIVALAQAVWRDLGITCGCFEMEGALSKKDAWISLVRDLILIWPTLWLATRPNRTLIGVWRGREQ
ncbi:MAG TPA: MauE/DoxX family redox-associated membrane protein [Fibrobacteria bacterium]|nr:MauE/DoxX family redox-associated membrane protein [Fibrobacteria bacterium]HOX50139.1 MauE/DoxX family redox-associated membrane protein [Fibrobacteria bacterium]